MTAVVVEAAVDMRCSPDDVFDYCSDPGHEPEWNPNMKCIGKLTDGPVGVGTRYATEFVKGPPMIMECTRYEPPTTWSWQGKSRALKAGGGGRVELTPEGAHLVMRMELEPHGLLKLATPLLRRRMRPMFQRDLNNIKARLEGIKRDTATVIQEVRTSSVRAGTPDGTEDAAVDLYWLPLGAGGHCVRINGRIFEAFSARMQRRDPCDIFHTALEVQMGPTRYVIEMAPVWNETSEERGVVAEGAVGHRRAGRFRLFRYEIRRWRDGRIPDVGEAVDSPRRLTRDQVTVARILDLVPQVPTAVWGRDELGTGEMWNSNSLISWLIAVSGIDTASIHPPDGGRAPGWQAGLVVAARAVDLARADVQADVEPVRA